MPDNIPSSLSGEPLRLAAANDSAASVGPSEGVVAPASPLPALTRAHFSRLRFYWVNRGATNQGSVLDLDLHRRGLVELREGWGGSRYFCTEAGVQALVEESDRNRSSRAPHHLLAGRLAQWLQEQGRMTWEGIEFSVKELNATKRATMMGIDVAPLMGVLYANPRPDVFSIVPTHNEARINPAVHEVKVSRADFLSDVAKPMKRLAYAHIAEVVYYATPAGLVQVSELPKNCGLVEESAPGEFKVVKRAKRMPVQLTPHHYLNMVLKPGDRNEPAGS